jgi:hypothetical protein
LKTKSWVLQVISDTNFDWRIQAIAPPESILVGKPEVIRPNPGKFRFAGDDGRQG